MDDNKLRDIAEFLHEALKVQRDPEEFTKSEFAEKNGMPLTTAREWLNRAERRGLLNSRKTSRGKFYKICNEEEWQTWLKQRSNPSISKN